MPFSERGCLDWVQQTESQKAAASQVSNRVGTALGFSFLLFWIPICAPRSEPTSKQLLSKCLLHKMLYSLGPLQFALVLWTFFVHFFRKTGSLGNVNRLTFCPYLLEQLAATQFFTILDVFWQNLQKSHSLSIIFIMWACTATLWRHV